MAVSLGYRNVYRDPYGFPQWKKEGLPTSSSPAGLSLSTGINEKQFSDQPLEGWALAWILLGVFAGGLTLNLTPCVYPMIPITVSFFGGRASEEKLSQTTLIAHGICYILGLALTNSTIGVTAALTGGLVGALLQNSLILSAVAGILFFFALSLFGFWELRLPGGISKMAGKSYAGYFGSFFMGLTMGIVAAPCIGPFVLGLLTWVAGIGNPWFGFLVFFTLSLGLGLPLFILALFSGQLQRLPRAGVWMNWVRSLMGWVLVGMAAYFIRPVLPETLKSILVVAVALAAGLHLGWFQKAEEKSKIFPWVKTIVGSICLVAATFWFTSWSMLGPGIAWESYSENLLEKSIDKGKPVIVDFYADWCAPCRELEAITFHHPDVVNLAQKDFTMIKIDLTQGDNPIHERLLQEYNVKGVPTVIFLNAQGEEHTGLRIVDFMPPVQFLIHMTSIKSSKP